MINKSELFQSNIRRSLREQWHNIETLLNTLPDDDIIDWDSLSQQHKATVNNIKSIESEWILDTNLRKELSVLKEDESDDRE